MQRQLDTVELEVYSTHSTGGKWLKLLGYERSELIATFSMDGKVVVDANTEELRVPFRVKIDLKPLQHYVGCMASSLLPGLWSTEELGLKVRDHKGQPP